MINTMLGFFFFYCFVCIYFQVSLLLLAGSTLGQEVREPNALFPIGPFFQEENFFPARDRS